MTARSDVVVDQEAAMVVGFQPVIQVNLVEIGRHEFLSEFMSLAAQDWNLKPGQHSNQ